MLKIHIFLLPAALMLATTADAGELHYPSVVDSFYKSRNALNAWTDPELVQQLEQTINDAALHGLSPEDYHSNQLSQGNDSILTDAFIAYAHDLRFGRAPHRLKGEDWTAHNDLELLPVLQHAISKNRIAEDLNNLAPSFDAYRALQNALVHYRQLAETGEWLKLQEAIDLESPENMGQQDFLCARLSTTKDFDSHTNLEQAVIRFQQRHGLSPDGIVGKQTLAALNIPLKQRISQMELNLERLRWMPREAPDEFVVVNVPGFELRIYEKRKIIDTMRVIVGKTTWCTPTFLSSEIQRIVLNPYWYVPAVIAKKEIYPLLQKDPAYLKRSNIHMISRADGDIQLRQSPGPRNSLGRIKFEFPNCCGCYLHDTPEKQLFDKVLRLFSHGCIRIERALVLGNWILGNEGWSEQDLITAIERNKTRTIILTRPVPIYIVYFTSWVNEDGVVQFRNDVYGKDKELAQSLNFK